MTGVGRDPRVLVVEDDDEIAQVLQRSLRLDGYDVRIAGDGEAALDQAAAYHPDLVILDLGLPKLDGIEVARRLRSADDVPILMLTARDAVEARVEGLDSGADDYLVKPFERQELLARLRALLRRRPPRGSASLVVSDLSLNPDTHEVTRAGRATEPTQREFELLEYLMRNERIVIPRQRLLEEVWGYDPFAATNTIEVFVSNLRRKLEAGGESRLLHTIRGAGYVLRACPHRDPLAAGARLGRAHLRDPRRVRGRHRPADGHARAVGLQQPGRGRDRRPERPLQLPRRQPGRRDPRRPAARPLRRLEQRGDPGPAARRAPARPHGGRAELRHPPRPHGRDGRLPRRDPCAQRARQPRAGGRAADHPVRPPLLRCRGDRVARPPLPRRRRPGRHAARP